MKIQHLLTRSFKLIAISLACSTITLVAAPTEIKSKIVIESVAQKDLMKDAPCFIVYPEGDAFKTLKGSGAITKIESAIAKLGYTIVEKDSDAVVYIRVGFTQHEPYSKEIEIKSRDQIDYSNSVSATNMAATTGTGRYKSLVSASTHETQTDPSSILGPQGQVITIGKQKSSGTTITEGNKLLLNTTIHPITFQVSAWVFQQSDAGVQPNQLWGVLVSYNNLTEEDAEPQLLDLSKAASRYFGKNLKKEKRVER